MARLSDLMWHAIWNAPVDEIVTADAAIARVRARRMTRWGSIGAGLAVVGGIIGLNVLIPALAADADPDPAALALSPSPTASRGPLTAYDLLDSWWGTCETDPLTMYPPGDTDIFSLDADLEPGAVMDPGSTLDLTTTLTALTDSDVLSDGVDAVILYDGRIVSSLLNKDILQLHSYAQGEASTTTLSVPLLICESTTELGAGDYELVLSQGYNPDIGGNAAQDGGTSELAPRVTAEPIPFSISGDPRTNPLNQPGGSDIVTSNSPPLPTDLLDPATAEQLLAPLMVENDWDMAPGTSRWIIPTYNYSNEPYYYGGYYSVYEPCAYTGLVDKAFPAISATADLFVENVTLPPSIGLRYGWVVRDDPILEVTRENRSGLYVPGSGYQAGVTLYLVRDGVLAGYGYATDVNEYVSREPQPVPISLAEMDPALYYGLVAPATSSQGRFVWQELHPCSTTAGVSSLSPGTYTVVTSHDFGLDMVGTGGAYSQIQLWTAQGTIKITE